MVKRFTVALFIAFLVFDGALSSCPCENALLCQTPHPKYANEVLAFSTYFHESPVPIHWHQYHWDKITTLVAHSYPDEELTKAMCYAHAHNTSVVILVGYPIEQLLNTSYHEEWAENMLLYIQKMHVDGINVDFEDAVYANQTAMVEGYTNVIATLYRKLKSSNSDYQVSIDSSWAPFCNDSTMCYNYKALSDVTDYIFTMSYDEQSQIFGPCVAGANAGYVKTSQGIEEFLNWGISPRKLVLGVPWYGYSYRCVHFYENNTCFIAHKALRTSNCSDIVGSEVSYSVVVGSILANSSSGRLWSERELSPYVNYKIKNDDAMHQLWYDDVASTRYKYSYAQSLGLRGVGMWAAESLDYDRQQDVDEMWGALPNFKHT